MDNRTRRSTIEERSQIEERYREGLIPVVRHGVERFRRGPNDSTRSKTPWSVRLGGTCVRDFCIVNLLPTSDSLFHIETPLSLRTELLESFRSVLITDSKHTP